MSIYSPVTCEHCGAIMEHCMGPRPNVPVHTYHATCSRLDIPATPDVPGTIYPQRCGHDCYRNIPAGATQ